MTQCLVPLGRLALLGALLLVVPSAARAGRPEPCAGGRFLVQGEPLIASTLSRKKYDALDLQEAGASIAAQDGEQDAITLTTSTLAFDLGCSVPGAVKVRSKKKFTKVVATWAAGTCRARKTKLVARIVQPACTTMRGKVRTRSGRGGARAFTAERSVCGDAIVDPEAGEGCDPPEVAICTRGCQPSVVAGSVLALTYNVAGLPEGISGSHPATNTPLIGPLLNGYDLVLVQESWQTPDPNPLAPVRVYHEILAAAAEHPYRSVPAPLPLGTDPRRPSALVSDGLNRFSRFPFGEIARVAWAGCLDTAADCLALKGFSMARTALVDGITVDVYNLHMEAGNDPEDDRLRDQGVSQMVAFMAEASAGRPIIVGGDFNLHSDREPDATTFQRLLREANLEDVCAALACPAPGRIDKFLFRSTAELSIVPTSWRFETDVFVDGMGEPLSDHDALAVRFDWTGIRSDP